MYQLEETDHCPQPAWSCFASCPVRDARAGAQLAGVLCRWHVYIVGIGGTQWKDAAAGRVCRNKVSGTAAVHGSRPVGAVGGCNGLRWPDAYARYTTSAALVQSLRWISRFGRGMLSNTRIPASNAGSRCLLAVACMPMPPPVGHDLTMRPVRGCPGWMRCKRRLCPSQGWQSRIKS